MASLQLNNIISGASKVIKNTLSNNKMAENKPIWLTQKQQVDLFLKMPESGLESIQVKMGEVEYRRYVQHMLNLSKEIYVK